MKYYLPVLCTMTIAILSCCGPSAEEKRKQDLTTVDLSISSALSEMAPPPPNTESYHSITENAFKAAKAEPLSTFAIDVDGASYSNARRMLMQGMLPPNDAVRTEEFINYFTYAYPKPEGEQPFSIYTEYANCPWAEGHKLLQIGLKGKEIDMKTAPDNNLVFLIDVSGSMEDENKLPLLKRAFKLLVNQLREDDKISLVVYAGSAGVVLDGEDGDEPEKILSALEQLQAGGSTAGGEGIELAYRIAKDHFKKKGNNRVIIATDGDFNVGLSSESELEKLIEEKRKDGIYLSVIGFGEGNIKDNVMETLADKGNGNYYYIDNFMEARKVLVSQFGGTLVTIAKDVKIQVEFNPALVKEYRLVGYENRLLNAEDFNDDKKDAGEIGAGHTVTALYEIIPFGSKDSKTNVDELKYKSGSANESEVANIKFRYKGVSKNDTTSKLISKIVSPYASTASELSANMRLAAGVAEFAMLLRDSEYKQNASFEQAIQLANSAKQNDPEGYISGLVELIKITKDLKTQVAQAH